MPYKYTYQIIKQDNFNGSSSPARTRRNTPGTTRYIYLNMSRCRHIKPEHLVFIILHEVGHNELDTSNETAVDAWAQAEYIKLGYPLTESVKALTQVLISNSPENLERCWNQYKRGLAIDNKVNKKDDFFSAYEYLLTNPKYEVINLTESFDGEYVDIEYFDLSELDQVKGISRKEQKKKKRAVRLYKRLGRGKKKHAQANDIQAGADTRKTYAEKGIYVPTRAESVGGAVSKSIAAVAGAVGGAFGGGAASGIADQVTGMIPGKNYSEENETPPIIKQTANRFGTPTTTGAPMDNKKMLMIGGGVAAFLIVGVLIVKS